MKNIYEKTEVEILKKSIDFYKTLINFLFAGYAFIGIFSFLSISQFNNELKEWIKIRYTINEKLKELEIKINNIESENNIKKLEKMLELLRQKTAE